MVGLQPVNWPLGSAGWHPPSPSNTWHRIRSTMVQSRVFLQHRLLTRASSYYRHLRTRSYAHPPIFCVRRLIHQDLLHDRARLSIVTNSWKRPQSRMPSPGSKWGWIGCCKYRFWRRGDYMVIQRWEMGWGRQSCRYASVLPILVL